MTMRETDRDQKWLHARPTAVVPDSWFVVIHGGYAGSNGQPDKVSLLWPEGQTVVIPNQMVLMTVAAFADLSYRAGAVTALGETERAAKE